MSDKLLVLDIDETLFHAMYPEQVDDAIDNGFMKDMDDCDFHMLVFPALERPYVHKFLNWAFKNFTIGIWSSATDDYVDDFIAKLITDPQHGEPLFVNSREHCTKVPIMPSGWESTHGQFEYVKDLRKLKKYGFPLERTIAVDDTPGKLQRQYGNLVRIEPFWGDKTDTELLKLMQYLDDLKEVPNVREVEKRGWSHKYDK